MSRRLLILASPRYFVAGQKLARDLSEEGLVVYCPEVNVRNVENMICAALRSMGPGSTIFLVVSSGVDEAVSVAEVINRVQFDEGHHVVSVFPSLSHDVYNKEIKEGKSELFHNTLLLGKISGDRESFRTVFAEIVQNLTVGCIPIGVRDLQKQFPEHGQGVRSLAAVRVLAESGIVPLVRDKKSLKRQYIPCKKPPSFEVLGSVSTPKSYRCDLVECRVGGFAVTLPVYLAVLFEKVAEGECVMTDIPVVQKAYPNRGWDKICDLVRDAANSALKDGNAPFHFWCGVLSKDGRDVGAQFTFAEPLEPVEEECPVLV